MMFHFINNLSRGRNAQSDKEYGKNGYVPIICFSGEKETRMFVEKGFLGRLCQDSRTERTHSVGTNIIDLLRPETWAIFSLVRSAEEGKEPSYWLYQSAEGIGGLEKARRDFASFQKEVSRRRLDIRFRP